MLVGTTMFLVGVASAVDMTVLVNQDSVWGYALILNGTILVFLVLRYGILAFRRNLYNKVRGVRGMCGRVRGVCGRVRGVCVWGRGGGVCV